MKKRLIKTTFTSSIILAQLLMATSVQANDDINSRISSAEETTQEAQSQVDSLEKELQNLEASAQSTEAQLSSLNSNISANQAKISEASAELEATQVEMNKLIEDIEVIEANIAKRTDRLEEQARTVQTNGQTTNYIEFILNSDSLTDAIGRVDVVVNIVRSNTSLVEEQVKDKEALASTKEATGETIRRQGELVTALETASQDLEQQRIEQEVLLAQLGADRATAESERDAFLAERDDAQARVDALVNEREEIEAELARQEQEAEEAEAVSTEELIESTRSELAQAKTVEEEVQVASANESQPAAQPASSSSNNNSAATSTRSTASSSSSNSSSSSSNSSSNSSRSSNSSSTNNSSSSSQSTQTATPAPAKTKAAPAPAPVSSGGVLGTANSLLGTRYSWGGTTPGGFDCSGFTQYVFRQNGISIPRDSRSQYAATTRVSNPVPGDLVFFGSGGRVTHVGIYAGGGRYVGAQTSTGVAYTNVHTGYWGTKFMGYGRV